MVTLVSQATAARSNTPGTPPSSPPPVPAATGVELHEASSIGRHRDAGDEPGFGLIHKFGKTSSLICNEARLGQIYMGLLNIHL